MALRLLNSPTRVPASSSLLACPLKGPALPLSPSPTQVLGLFTFCACTEAEVTECTEQVQAAAQAELQVGVSLV